MVEAQAGVKRRLVNHSFIFALPAAPMIDTVP
jgi:hypothetical protein